MSVHVRPATPDRWNDVVSVFGRRGDDPSWCWCRLFLSTRRNDSAASTSPADNREALRKEIADAEVPPGLVAYVDGQPVDVARLTAARVSGAAIYTGTVAMFAAAGFSEIGRTYPTRPVMRLAV